MFGCKFEQQIEIWHVLIFTWLPDLFSMFLPLLVSGTTASDTDFQAMLLKGILRWNEDRMTAAVAGLSDKFRCFDDKLKAKHSRLSTTLWGRPLVEHQPPLQTICRQIWVLCMNSVLRLKDNSTWFLFLLHIWTLCCLCSVLMSFQRVVASRNRQIHNGYSWPTYRCNHYLLLLSEWVSV